MAATGNVNGTSEPLGRWPGVSPAVVALVALLLAGLYFVDRSLATMEHNELQQEAVRLAADGTRLLESNRPNDAANKLRQAHALFRQDRGYALSYADALLHAGRTADAQDVLQESLNRNPNDGKANLLMARAMAYEHRPIDAASFYHRAIYGKWDGDGEAKAIQARLEFADWLAKNQSKDALLAELLPLEAASGHDAKMQARLAGLFLKAGAPERAAEEYKKIIAADEENLSAFAGLGEAEMELGNDHGAERAFQKAEMVGRLDVVREVIALDPTPRRLSSAEKYGRSMRLLEMTATALKACPAAMARGEEAEKALANAERMGKEKRKGLQTNEFSEERLDLAAAMWRIETKACPRGAEGADPLTVVMRRIGSQ
jgi:Tfp pilus assembly protein PilF